MSLKIYLDASDTVNVALNRPASQSSTSQWSVPNESQRAVNGHRSGSFSFHTSFEPEPWWQVDLEKDLPLDAIVVWNRDDEYAGRANSLRIQISLNGIDWVTVHQGLTYFRGTRGSRPLVHLLDGQVVARFVRVSLTQEVPLHLDQVEVLVSKNIFAADAFWNGLPYDNLSATSLREHRNKYRVVSGSVSCDDLQIRALRIERFGRFGNNFHQILNAAVLANEWKIDTILLDEAIGSELLTKVTGVRCGDTQFFAGNSTNVGRALSGHFYFVEPFSGVFRKVSSNKVNEVLRTTVLPLYQKFLDRVLTPTVDAMHFHFRSGDIFSDPTPHGGYVQPPLAFYKAVLHHAVRNLGVRSVVIVYEDTKNPCVVPFVEYLESISFEFHQQSGSLQDDINELLRAKIICYGFGTFIESILCLSPYAISAYAFRDVEAFPGANKFSGCGIREILMAKGLLMHVVRDFEGGYIDRDRWMNTEAQRQLMLSFPEEALRIEVI